MARREKEGAPLRVRDGEPEALPEALGVPDGRGETVPRKEALPAGDGEALPAALGVCGAEAVRYAEAERVGEALPLAAAEAVGAEAVAEAEAQPEALREVEAQADAVARLGVPEAVAAEGEAPPVALSAPDQEGEPLSVTRAVGPFVAFPVAETLPVGGAVSVGVAPAEAVRWPLVVAHGDARPLLECTPDAEKEALPVGEAHAEGGAVPVAVTLGEPVPLALPRGESDASGDAVAARPGEALPVAQPL